MWRGAIRATILGADIERGVFRRCASGDRVKFGSGVVAEENVVMQKVAATRSGRKAPDPGRKAARLDALVWHCGAHAVSEHTQRQRTWIARKNYSVSCNTLTGPRDGNRRPPALTLYSFDRALVVHFSATAFGQSSQRGGKPVHPAIHPPHPKLFGPPDQRQQRRRGIGRSTNIGRISAEQLPKARISKGVRQSAGHFRPGRECGQNRRIPQR